MSLRGIKLVTFDVTNTLLKFKMPPWQYYTMVAKDHGYVGTGDDIKVRLPDSMKLMWNLYPNYGKSSISWEKWWSDLVKMTFQGYLPLTADVDTMANQIINDYKTSKCWYIAEGSDKLIEYIRNMNIPTGVISNFDPRLYSILRDTSLLDKFDFILSSYDIGYSKPDVRIFESAIEISKQNINPYEALHIGDDAKKDYQGARSAGWHALLVNPNLNTKTPPAPEHVFKSLDALYETIEKEKLKL